MRTIKARGAKVNVGNGPEVDLIDNDGDVWRYNSNDNTYTVETGNVPFSWRNLLGIEEGELDFYVLEETSVWGVGDELYNSAEVIDVVCITGWFIAEADNGDKYFVDNGGYLKVGEDSERSLTFPWNTVKLTIMQMGLGNV